MYQLSSEHPQPCFLHRLFQGPVWGLTAQSDRDKSAGGTEFTMSLIRPIEHFPHIDSVNPHSPEKARLLPHFTDEHMKAPQG